MYSADISVAFLIKFDLLCVLTGKRKCVENSQKILKVLTDLLGHENQEVVFIHVHSSYVVFFFNLSSFENINENFMPGRLQSWPSSLLCCVGCVILNFKSAAFKLNVMLVVNCLFQLDANNVKEIFIDIYVYFHRLHVVLLGPACVVLSPCSSIVIVQQKSRHRDIFHDYTNSTIFYTLQFKHSFLKLLPFLGITLAEATNSSACNLRDLTYL